MNGKRFIIPILALCFTMSISGLCSGEDLKNTLTVNSIVFTLDKTGRELITFFCNQPCTPELSSLEEENPRVVMDMRGVLQIKSKTRNINTGGKFIKRIRSYLDKQTNILRVVLDMEPSKNYTVCPIQGTLINAYMLGIEEREQELEGSKDTKDTLLPQEKCITILRPDLRPEKKPTPPENPETGTASVKVYTGGNVTLDFIKTDIRHVFALISEAAQRQIILNDAVQGTITLRLIDVPWDRALEAILSIYRLKRVDEGSIIRIYPQDKS